jgi:hypothetical protein
LCSAFRPCPADRVKAEPHNIQHPTSNIDTLRELAAGTAALPGLAIKKTLAGLLFFDSWFSGSVATLASQFDEPNE